MNFEKRNAVSAIVTSAWMNFPPNRPSEKDEFGNADLVDRKNYKNRAL